MQDQQTMNTETLLSMLQQSQEELKVARATINEQSEDIAILSAYITDHDGQHKTEMKEAEMAVSQLRDQVAAVTSDLRAVKCQLTEKTMTTNQHQRQVAALASELDMAKSRLMKKEEETTQLEDQVSALTSELEVAKSRLMKKEEETTQLEDRVAALTSELDKLQLMKKDEEATQVEDQVSSLTSGLEVARLEEEKSQPATTTLATSHDSLDWILMCMAGLVVVVVYGWELVVALASWVYSIVVAACSKVKTTAMKTRTVATKTRTTTVKTTIAAEMARPEFDCMDNRDQNIKTANEFGFVRCTRGRCLLLVSGVLLLLFGCVALATHDGNIELHNLTSASRNNSSIDVVTGLADDGKAWLAVDDGASRPVSIASIRDSPGGSQKTAQRDDPMLESKLDRLGCIVVTMFGVAATTAGHVLKLWVGYGVMSSLLQLYSS